MIDTVKTWITPGLILLSMYFIKSQYEEIVTNQKAMMLAVPVLQEQLRQLEVRTSNIEKVVFSGTLDSKGKPATFIPTYFLKPDDIQLPKE